MRMKRDSRGRQTKSGGLAAGGLASLGARHLLQPRVPHGAGTAPAAPCHPPGTPPPCSGLEVTTLPPPAPLLRWERARA